eukprot:TRINITY_DN2968_c0_g1_i1.p1 TRINITY_DN2968_c0_g1~~TRINITY_DN2968_c0_g1_i1.p1  ORF type:complete len:508 (-),score=183.74 TRINITY_DN2968_c0_g1_i1:380-1903(-)
MTEPTPPFDVRAIAVYAARNNTEVSLEVGKTYHVLQTDGKGLWWQTRAEDGRIGWFPASYTEVVPSAAPSVASTPAPVPTPTPAPTPVATTTQTTQAQPASSSPQIQNQNSSNAPGGQPPAPTKPIQKEKGPDAPVFVKVQICEAKNLRGEAAKCKPTAFVFRREVMDDGKGEKLFQTAQMKKTNCPKWNELYQINVHDAESEIVVVRFTNGTKWVNKGKEYLGEIEFPLRGAVRNFDSPNFKYQWYPIKGKGPDAKEVTGEALIYIEFVDTRQNSGPKNVEHVGHVGWSADGGFDIKNIPAEWKKIFKNVGLKKKDLENNPELANNIFNIMSQANVETGEVSSQPAQQSSGYEQQQPSQQQTYQEPVHQPAPVVSNAPAPPPPPPQPTNNPKAPPPPPPPGNSTKAPPPPPPPAADSGAGAAASSGPAPPPPPPVASSGGSGLSLAEQLAARKELKKVSETPAPPPKPAPESSSSLADTLRAAMAGYRKDIAKKDNEDEDNDDDWD